MIVPAPRVRTPQNMTTLKVFYHAVRLWVYGAEPNGIYFVHVLLIQGFQGFQGDACATLEVLFSAALVPAVTVTGEIAVLYIPARSSEVTKVWPAHQLPRMAALELFMPAPVLASRS